MGARLSSICNGSGSGGGLTCNSKKNHGVDVDTAWRQQNKELKENALFRFIDFTPSGGSLVHAFEEHGRVGVLHMARSQLSSFLYNDGDHSSLITELDYARWLALRHDKAAGTNDSKQLSSEDILVKYRQSNFSTVGDHEACWDINKRGPVGETALHLCILNDTPVHLEIARILLEAYPNLALDIYEGEEYYGESALHLAIANGDIDSVKLLTEKGAKVNQRATGNFFLPEDQKKRLTKSTDYCGFAYYGEYPLSFASSFGHESIYDYLISKGGDPNARDTFGNTVLHMAVINDQPSMYAYAVHHYIRKADPWAKNDSGHTPLSLACKLGRQRMFEELLEIHKIEFWRYSNINCSLYPLHAIDTIGSSGCTNWNSALMIIVNEEKEEHLEMLQSKVVHQLLDEKWKTFIRRKFFLQFALAGVHLLLLSMAIYLRPDSNIMQYTGPKDGVRFACEIAVCVACCLTLLLSFNTLRICGIRHYLKSLRNVPSVSVFLVACFLLLCCVPVRFASLGWSTAEAATAANVSYKLLLVEESLLIFAVPMSWFILLFFAKAHELTGDSVLMFYKIVRGDMFRFAIIYGIFLLCFGQAFFSLFRGCDPPSDKYTTIEGTIMSLFLMTLQEYDFTEFENTKDPALTKIVFALFMILMPILLLNMLIAMMGETYERQLREERSRKDWIRQWAKVVVFLERSFSKKELLAYQKDYSVRVDSPPSADRVYLDKEAVNEDCEYRALMAIKQSTKTKAKQRKTALANWKLLTKRALSAIRKLREAGRVGPFDYSDLFPDDRRDTAYVLSRHGGLLRRKETLHMETLTAALEKMSQNWNSSLKASRQGTPDGSGMKSYPAGSEDHYSRSAVQLAPLDEVICSPGSSTRGSATPSETSRRLTLEAATTEASLADEISEQVQNYVTARTFNVGSAVASMQQGIQPVREQAETVATPRVRLTQSRYGYRLNMQ